MSKILGKPIIDDAAKRGSTFRRKTQMYTNLGKEEDWDRLPLGPPIPPHQSLGSLLREGERVQRWNRARSGPPEWPNEEGKEIRVWPKVVRSLGSHEWRKASDSVSTWDQDRATPKHDAIGVSLWQGRKCIPSPEMIEQGMGLWAGYSASALHPDGRKQVINVAERYGMLGDQWDMNLITAVLQDRIRSSDQMAGFKRLWPTGE